ncbi:NADP-dependent oxidoreductase [Halomonas sp. MCCC 1A11036]|uniref:NADP-dependent oxidoreductase n=1 Tax=Billgrantia zhangzhouensis TaxID=2733481 RepID=A0ABS9AK16_9GAMM|nr:NADP-dependent oxidoreductase [Halomonas zhangzhouensis]MCE8021968.1 NADP-dependent oxidoreductase [Halomonas zhangzhouensis]
MKAVYFERTGGPEVLRYGDLTAPQAGPGGVLVAVRAASVNGVDWRIRAGRYKPIRDYPYVLGRDFSGIVEAVGAGVDERLIGSPVFGVCETTDDGAYAEKVAIQRGNVTLKPDWLSHEEAAAIALIGLTAVVSVEETLALRSGERVLIQGGAGGVGGIAIQLAKHLGAHVVTTASPANHAYLRSLGADEVIDYHSQDFSACVSGCDAVLDTVGGDVAERSFAVLRPGGRAAFIASGPTAPRPTWEDVVALRPQVARDARHLRRMLQLVESGAVKIPEIAVYRLEEAAKAHVVSESRHLRGKLVLRVG